MNSSAAASVTSFWTKRLRCSSQSLSSLWHTRCCIGTLASVYYARKKWSVLLLLLELDEPDCRFFVSGGFISSRMALMTLVMD
jgi:hypothetical protein